MLTLVRVRVSEAVIGLGRVLVSSVWLLSITLQNFRAKVKWDKSDK